MRPWPGLAWRAPCCPAPGGCYPPWACLGPAATLGHPGPAWGLLPPWAYLGPAATLGLPLLSPSCWYALHSLAGPATTATTPPTRSHATSPAWPATATPQVGAAASSLVPLPIPTGLVPLPPPPPPAPPARPISGSLGVLSRSDDLPWEYLTRSSNSAWSRGAGGGVSKASSSSRFRV